LSYPLIKQNKDIYGQLATEEYAKKKQSLSNGEEKVSKKSTKLPRWWLVLPCLLNITAIITIEPTLMNDLIVTRFEKRYNLYITTNDQERSACLSKINNNDNSHNTTHVHYNKVQQSVAKLNIYTSVASVIPTFISFILFSVNSDIIGRKPLIILPYLGKTCRYIILLIVIKQNLADIWIIIAEAIDSLSGTSSLIVLSSFAYVSDCTTLKTRTVALIITEASMAIARILPSMGIGFLLKLKHYMLLTSVILVLSIIGLFYAIFLQPESVLNVKHLNLFSKLKLIRLKPISRVINAFTIKRSSNNRQILILLTLIQVMSFLMIFSANSVFTLYLYGQPLCYGPLDVSLLTVAQTISIISLSIVITTIFHRQLNTLTMPVIGCLAFMIHLIIVGLAKVKWLFYVAVCTGSSFYVTLSILRSKVTNVVNDNEFALVFIATGLVESVGTYLIAVGANFIYNITIHIYPATIFFISCGMGIIPLILLGYLTYIERNSTSSKQALSNVAKTDV
ncbi:unnamed protein product, partial [Didymodactylos carnosus]